MTRTTQWLYGWLLLLPAMALLVLFTHYPAVATLWHSFFSTPKGSPSRGVRRRSTTTSNSSTTRSSGRRSSTTSGTRSARFPRRSCIALLMAVWVNERIAGRGLLRLAYFTPTVLPMIAVANIWLFFYTPEYGLLEKFLGRVRRRHATTGSAARARRCPR